MIRHPTVAGQFYPLRRDRLISEIEASFTCRLGPGLPGKKSYKSLRGVIVPHAGYIYSGPCAAHAYKQIAESVNYDMFLCLGPNHTGIGAHHTATCLADWRTPLGVAVCDKEFASELIENTEIEDDISPHIHEHSIEVQLPFLQYIFGNIKFVPVAVSHRTDFERLGSQIRDIIKASRKKVCIVTSSDFTHYGPNYGYIPFTKDLPQNLRSLDMGAIEHILGLDGRGFQEYVSSKGATICGQHAISLMLEALPKEVKNGELLKYYTSGDIMKDYRNSVSYASIKF